MERREFLTATGAAGAALVFGRTVHAPRAPLERLQQELKARQLDLLVAEPSTNFQYLTGYNPGRSERLILLMGPGHGRAVADLPLVRGRAHQAKQHRHRRTRLGGAGRPLAARHAPAR